MKNIFSISNLVCSYSGKPEEKVLEISELEIPEGKLTFLLGSSGSGKSTLLETLGMMNNTIASGKVNLNYNNESIELHQLWNGNNEAEISKIRKRHLSFIFQNTNLMENFTAYENISLSRMIKESIGESDVLAGAKELMKKVNLPENEVDETTLAVNLSGGQKQRLAFVRALNTNTTILLGDEPTGNLDEANANELISILKNNSKNITSIIVSHDINLALNHCDRIVVLTKDKSKGYGEILKENIFDRSIWENYNPEELLKFKNKIKALFSTNVDHAMASEERAKAKKKIFKTYNQLFFNKESKAIAGKSMINLLILSGILFFTFISIGFANGCLDYLDKKLNSPFVQWLTISIPWTKSTAEQVNGLKKELDDPELKSKFEYKDISTYKEFNFLFYNKADTSKDEANKYQAKGLRTLDFERDKNFISNFILSKKNTVFGEQSFNNNEDISLIVTKRLLTDLGYDINTPYINIREFNKDTSSDQNLYYSIPIPIRAVVNELPGKSMAVCLTSCYESYNQREPRSPFEVRGNTNYIEFFIQGEMNEAIEFRKKLLSITDANEDFKTYDAAVENPEPHKATYHKGFDIRVSFSDPNVDSSTLNSRIETFYSLIENGLKLKSEKNIYRTYDYSGLNRSVFPSPDYYSVYFTNLSKIRPFSEYILKKFNDKDDKATIEVDTSKVIEKENFYFLSTITYIIAYLVILFGTITVSLFLFNLLKLHLNKVKMNIGTFKAIGLNNSESLNIYFSIIFIFIVTGIIVSVLSAYLVGNGVDFLLKSKAGIEQDISYFQLWNLNTLVAMGVIIVSGIIISWTTIRSILSKSPGDLIYNR